MDYRIITAKDAKKRREDRRGDFFALSAKALRTLRLKKGSTAKDTKKKRKDRRGDFFALSANP